MCVPDDDRVSDTRFSRRSVGNRTPLSRQLLHIRRACRVASPVWPFPTLPELPLPLPAGLVRGSSGCTHLDIEHPPDKRKLQSRHRRVVALHVSGHLSPNPVVSGVLVDDVRDERRRSAAMDRFTPDSETASPRRQ